jgi:hypothetical protein
MKWWWCPLCTRSTCLVRFFKQQEEFEDTKGAIRIHILKNRQHNDQKKKDKQRSTKHTYKTKDRVTWTPTKPGVNSGAG